MKNKNKSMSVQDCAQHVLSQTKNQIPTNLNANALEKIGVLNLEGLNAFAGDAIGLESAKQDSKKLSDTVSSIIVSLEELTGVSVTPAQRKAAMDASKLCANNYKDGSGQNMFSYLSKLNDAGKSNADSVLSHESFIAAANPVSEYNNSLSLEKFDGQSFSNALYFSITFELLAAKQDSFGEAFFPTLTINATDAGYLIETEYTSIYKILEATSNGEARAKQMQKIPLIKSIFDPKIMGEDSNRIYPVAREDNSQILLTAYSHTVESFNEKYNTCPIKFGKEVNLTALSNTDAMLAKGGYDGYDALDAAMKLEKIYFKVKIGSKEAVVPMDVSMLPGSSFAAFGQMGATDWAKIGLAFNNKTLKLSRDTLDVTKTNLNALFADLGDYTIKLGVGVNGIIDVAVGDASLNANPVTIVSIYDSLGAALEPTSETYKTIVQSLTIDPIGYDLEMRRTNSNIKTKGFTITNDVYRHFVNVPVRSGAAVMLPVVNAQGTENDVNKIASQIAATNFRTSYMAVHTLIKTVDYLRVATARKIQGFETADFVGAAKPLINTYFEEDGLEMINSVDSIKSSERYDDMRAAIINKIRDMVSKAYIDSGYKLAFESQYAASGIKPTVLIGCDAYVHSWLTSSDEMINLGEQFAGVKVVSSLNPQMQGKIVIVFVLDTPEVNEKINPFQFGNCLWSATITTDFQKTINNAVVREVQNFPRFAHVVNVPVIMQINISGISDVFKKLPFQMINVTE